MEWSDEDPSLDDILTDVSLYWFTSSFTRSIYPYRALFSGKSVELPKIDKPLGISWFPLEIMPIIKSIVEKENNLVFYKAHKRGGHFAALERPKELLEDVEAFVSLVWKA